MLLSIVIPVYNVEKYLKRCLDSIFLQNIDSSVYEVIVVNDGSPDKSSKIISKYATLYKNLIVINQKNQGLSIARNNGINAASGDYIWCVDSDDWLADGSLITIIELLKQNKVDVISMLSIRISDVTDEILKTDSFRPKLCNKTIVNGPDYLFDGGFDGIVQLFVFKRKFLETNKLFFYPRIVHEDNEFCMRALYLAKNIYLLKTPTYYYRVRITGSIMSSFGKRDWDSFKIVCDNLINFENNIVKKEDRKYYHAKICQMMFYPIYSSRISWYKRNSNEMMNYWHLNKKWIMPYLWRAAFGKYFKFHYLLSAFLLTFFPKVFFKKK